MKNGGKSSSVSPMRASGQTQSSRITSSGGMNGSSTAGRG